MALLANHRHSDPERRFDMIITILKGLKISLRTYKNSMSTPFMFNLLNWNLPVPSSQPKAFEPNDSFDQSIKLQKDKSFIISNPEIFIV